MIELQLKNQKNLNKLLLQIKIIKIYERVFHEIVVNLGNGSILLKTNF